MSKNIQQIYVDNPITVNDANDLMYFGQSPYGAGDDAAMKFSDFNTQLSGEFLQKSNNLSDVADYKTSRSNIGLPTQILIADQDQDYTLTNPSPGIIYINMPTSGHTLKLPPLGVLGALDPSTNVEITVLSTSQPIQISNSAGDNIILASPNDKYLAIPVGTILIPTTGWYFQLISGAGSLQNMQQTYDEGSTISLNSGQPIEISTGDILSAAQNLTSTYRANLAPVTNPSQVIGMTFTMSKTGYITALGYAFPPAQSGTRQVGLWLYLTDTTGTLLATATVSSGDPLDAETGAWNMHAITPVAVTAGVRYVVANLNPITDEYLFYQAPNPTFGVVDGYSNLNFTSATLVYPPNYDGLSGSQWGNANLQFQSILGSSSTFSINDKITSPGLFFEIQSTSQSSLPVPPMTTAQKNAISSPTTGSAVFDADLGAYSFYNGVSWSSFSSSIVWQIVTGTSQAILPGHAYIANNASVQIEFTLPTASSLGGTFSVFGQGAGGWKIKQDVGQSIYCDGLTTTVGTGGYIEAVDINASITISNIDGTATIFSAQSLSGALNLV